MSSPTRTIKVHYEAQQYLTGQQILQGLDVLPAAATSALTFQTPAGTQFTLQVGTAAAPLQPAPDASAGPLLPASVAPGPATISVRAGGGELANGQATITSAGPGIFVVQATDASQPGAVENQDYSLNSRSNPAAPGSVVQIFATGDGELAGSAQVYFGDTPAQILFSGDLTQYPGLWQINAVVPPTDSGQVPIFISDGGLTSNAVTIWVH